MASSNVLNSLYNKHKSPLETYFDRLVAPPLLSLLTPMDVFELNKIARSVKLTGKIEEKYRLIDNIMNNRGFIKLHAGTNRVVYRFLEDQSFVIKVAIDRVGLGDNPAEFNNQFLLKPFVTKVFEVSPCGTVGLFERVDAIMSREEFLSVADDVFNLITKFFVGKYILEDFGSHYFLNWGIRRGTNLGLVLLDFPYVYELDGNKLYCNAPLIIGQPYPVCGGQLDYDDGFNNLICTKCGKHYQARDLKKAEKQELIIVGGKKTMRVIIKVGNDVIVDSSKKKVSTVIEQPEENYITIPKEDSIIQSKINSRSDVHIKPKVSELKSNASILNKLEQKKEEVVEEVKEDIIEKVVVETKEVIEDTTIDNDLESVLQQYIEQDDHEDEEDYEQYLSNRQRASKPVYKSKKGNGDFSEF